MKYFMLKPYKQNLEDPVLQCLMSPSVCVRTQMHIMYLRTFEVPIWFPFFVNILNLF